MLAGKQNEYWQRNMCRDLQSYHPVDYSLFLRFFLLIFFLIGIGFWDNLRSAAGAAAGFVLRILGLLYIGFRYDLRAAAA